MLKQRRRRSGYMVLPFVLVSLMLLGQSSQDTRPIAGAKAVAFALNPTNNDPGAISNALANPACESASTSPTCEALVVGALDAGRSSLGMSSYVLPPDFYSMSAEEQLLFLINEDRGEYSLPVVSGALPALNQASIVGAQSGSDPVVPSGSDVNGATAVSVGSNWFGATDSVNWLAVYYDWMYNDGYGSNNSSCTSPNAYGCWEHRDNILFGGGGTNGVYFGMGQASSGQFLTSDALVICSVDYSASVTLPVLDAWSSLSPLLSGRSTSGAYWLVAADGGIFTFGDANYYGSTGAMTLNKPIVGMAATPDGKGYWLVAADGGIFTFGDANYYGSTGAMTLNKPIVGMAATPDGKGYWLVAADGGIFTFGDANYYGSTGAMTLNKPIVGMAATPDGKGYWLVAADGGIFTFGDAPFLGSLGGTQFGETVVGMFNDTNSPGYSLVTSSGDLYSFGSDPYLGSLGDMALNRPVVGGI